MDALFNPVLLYSAFALGAAGVCLALPRKGVSPQVIGGLVAAAAFGGLLLAMGLRSEPGSLPNFHYYLFSLISLGSALRVISHQRPVYAALYFILTILSSSGLYVLLSAEFMAFALIIVYAGAILITYLFVLMLATEAPTAEQAEALSDYDRYSREPVIATIAGFVLVAVLTTMMGQGAGALRAPDGPAGAERLEELPGRVGALLREAGLMERGEWFARDETGRPMIDADERAATIVDADGLRRTVDFPDNLELYNVEGIAFVLLADHPGTIEIAGVVLLMAMLGAVVLARKKVEIDERLREEAQARHLHSEEEGAA